MFYKIVMLLEKLLIVEQMNTIIEADPEVLQNLSIVSMQER